MEQLHDWHVTAYMLAVHGLIDTTRIREVNGRIVIDNDPEKEALCKSLDDEQRVAVERMEAQLSNIYQERCELVDAKLQAALSPPPPPRIEPELPAIEPVLPPAGVTNKKWTAERLAELSAYRAAHTMPETAKHFGISESRIRELQPRRKSKPKMLISKQT